MTPALRTARRPAPGSAFIRRGMTIPVRMSQWELGDPDALIRGQARLSASRLVRLTPASPVGFAKNLLFVTARGIVGETVRLVSLYRLGYPWQLLDIGAASHHRSGGSV